MESILNCLLGGSILFLSFYAMLDKFQDTTKEKEKDTQADEYPIQK